MKCIICGKPMKKKKSFFYEVHEGKCSQVRSIVCTNVYHSKYAIKGTDDLEVLELALEYEKRSSQPRKGIIQGIERRMRKVKKESPRKCRVCGCTDNKACPGGCYWVEDDLCSRCKS